MPQKEDLSVPHRFVVYRPDAQQLAITGNFTEWKTVSMKRTGPGGYWEVTLKLPKGEYRYAYILDGHQQLADPTVQAREQDDFGGENSVLRIDI